MQRNICYVGLIKTRHYGISQLRWKHLHTDLSVCRSALWYIVGNDDGEWIWHHLNMQFNCCRYIYWSKYFSMCTNSVCWHIHNCCHLQSRYCWLIFDPECSSHCYRSLCRHINYSSCVQWPGNNTKLVDSVSNTWTFHTELGFMRSNRLHLLNHYNKWLYWLNMVRFQLRHSNIGRALIEFFDRVKHSKCDDISQFFVCI